MKEIFKGALLGFALGDALGNSVADLSKKEIQNRWGSSGISRPNRHPVLHSFSNSGLTEEMCFILDGLLWANRVFMDPFLPVKRSMYRWLYNTTKLLPSPDDEIWLKRQPHEEKNSILNIKEFSGETDGVQTSLEVLRSGFLGSVDMPINDSGEGDTISRVLPVGLYYKGREDKAFSFAMRIAALTHGDRDTILCAGFFSAMVSNLVVSKKLNEGFEKAIHILQQISDAAPLVQQLIQAKTFGDEEESLDLEDFVWGKEGTQSLLFSIYAIFRYREWEQSLLHAVNQNGDTRWTGAMVGGILGLVGESRTLPYAWIQNLKLHNYLREQAERLADAVKRI